jgi:hypothetical protein
VRGLVLAFTRGAAIKIGMTMQRRLYGCFAASDYVLSDKPHRFVVDGQHNDVISGPARSNDNFDIVNCYFAYNPTLRRLELITRAPLEEGIYEALTNYDTP